MPANPFDFPALIASGAQILGASYSVESPDTAYMQIGDTAVGLFLETNLQLSSIRCYFDLGFISEADAPSVWRRMLIENLDIGSVGFGVFGWHEELHHPLLVLYLFDALSLSSADLADLLRCAADQSQRWRMALSN